MKKRKKRLWIFLPILVILAVIPLIINGIVVFTARKWILSEEEVANLHADCMLVLGAYAVGDRLSPMLQDRVEQGIALYEAGAAPKILMSGDHGREDYDEVNAMKSYALAKGVPDEDVFMDHAGFSTYESAYRAKAVFQAQTVIIVTQEYHLYRAVYVARRLGLHAYGVASDPRPYKNQAMREIREIAARNKDFFYSIFKPKPTYLGEVIPVFGDGRQTNDK